MNHRIVITFMLLFLSITMMAQVNNESKLVILRLGTNGNFPNNEKLPVLLYKNVFEFREGPEAAMIESIFARNNWGGSWRNGVYDFQHYHSTAHEALGVYRGWARIQLGGEGSDIVKVEKGDLVVLPAGIAHKRIESGDGFAVVGAYPDGQRWDMNYGREEEKGKAQISIRKVLLPSSDPVFGKNGKMFEVWK